MMFNKIPLRYSIPVGILLFNLALLSVNFLTGKQAMVEQTIHNSSENLGKIGMLLSSQVESSLRNDKKIEAQDLINQFAGFRNIVHVYLIDSQKKILLSDNSREQGAKMNKLPGFETVTGGDNANGRIFNNTYYNPSEQYLYNFNQVSIRTSAVEFIPENKGYLIIVQDLEGGINQLQQPIRSRAWRDLGIYLLFSLLLWLVFHYIFLRRIIRILRNFREPGNLKKNTFNGRDEISSLARGFLGIHNRLGRSLTRYQTMLNNSNVAISELDAQGRYTYVNNTWTRLFGYNTKEILGKEPAMLFNSEEGTSPLAIKLRSGEITQYTETRLFKNKEGKKIWCELYAGANLIEGEVESIVNVMFDISPLKKVQDELRKQNKFIRTILDNVPLGIAVNRMDEGNATYINKQFENIYGWPKAELTNVNEFFQRVYPEKAYREMIMKRITEDIDSRDPSRMKWENIESTTKNGDKRIINAENIPLYEQNLMISTVQDVTEKVKYKNDRDRIFEQSVDMVCTASLDGYLLTLNPAWKKVLGWTVEELQSKPFFDFIHPEDLEMTNKMATSLRAGKPVVNFENRYQTKTGEYRWLSWNTIPIPKEDIMMGIARDITDMKEVQEALFKSQQQLQNVTDNIPGAIFQYVIYPDGRDALEYVSEGANEIWGISPQLAKGNMQYVWDHIHNEDLPRVKESIEGSYRDMNPWSLEFRNILPDGTIKWTLGISIPQKRKDGSVTWDSLLLDITDRKKAEIQLRNYQKELKQLTMELSVAEERQRKAIAANIHDHLSQSLVISKMKLNDLEKEQSLQPFISVIQYVKNHISEALENSRKITYDLSPPILYEMGLVETMYWLTDKTEEENQLDIDFSTEFDELILPEATMIMLYRAIQEILYNVIKHADADRVAIRFISKNNGLEIAVEDNGKGFNVSEALRTSTRKGFGLFTVQERIQNLSGEFLINSQQGKGTVVKMYIPLNHNS